MLLFICRYCWGLERKYSQLISVKVEIKKTCPWGVQLVPADYVCSGYTHWLLLITGETGPLNYSVNLLKWTYAGQTLLLSQGQNTQEKPPQKNNYARHSVHHNWCSKKTVYVQKTFCSLWNKQSLTPYAATFSTMNTLKPTVKNRKGV